MDNLEDKEIDVNIDPRDYIMSRVWDSGKLHERALSNPFIYFDDLKEVLSTILSFDNMEGM